MGDADRIEGAESVALVEDAGEEEVVGPVGRAADIDRERNGAEGGAAAGVGEGEREGIDAPGAGAATGRPGAELGGIGGAADERGALPHVGAIGAELEALGDRHTIAAGGEGLAAIVDAVNSGDLSAVKRHAHTLKGASANLRALPLAECAQALENAATQGDLQRCRGVLGDVQSDYRRTTEFISAHGA